ncbi:MAG: tail fiber protein [Pseudomonas protegens]
MDYPKSVPSVGLVNGKFVDENPVTGQVGSLISSDWGNAVTDELLNVIRAGGKEPAEAEHDQLLAAIKAIVRDSIPPEKIRSTLAEYGITDAYTKSVTYTKAEIEALLKNMSALPVGAMVPFPKGTVPAGFLEVDGSVQSTATYPDLAAYLGATFNTGGEGAGNFRLPESRGEFLRGWDHGRGVDAGRGLGSWQADEFKSHTHSVKDSSYAGNVFDSWVYGDTGNGVTEDENLRTNSSGGSETRPRNLAVMWCIKAWNAPINQGNIDIAALASQLAQATENKQGTARVSTQAQVDSGIDDSLIVTPRKYRAAKGTCSAWVSWNGTGAVTIRDSYNVSSVTDNGVGDFTVNILPGVLANGGFSYCYTVGGSTNSLNLASGAATTPTATSLRVVSVSAPGMGTGANFQLTDFPYNSVQIFGGK